MLLAAQLVLEGLASVWLVPNGQTCGTTGDQLSGRAVPADKSSPFYWEEGLTGCCCGSKIYLGGTQRGNSSSAYTSGGVCVLLLLL